VCVCVCVLKAGSITEVALQIFGSLSYEMHIILYVCDGGGGDRLCLMQQEMYREVITIKQTVGKTHS